MTWLKFFAAPEDFPPLLEQLLTEPRRLFEVYSEPGQHAREYAAISATRSLPLGQDPDGNGVALHFALWVPSVMPQLPLCAGSSYVVPNSHMVAGVTPSKAVACSGSRPAAFMTVPSRLPRLAGLLNVLRHASVPFARGLSP